MGLRHDDSRPASDPNIVPEMLDKGAYTISRFGSKEVLPVARLTQGSKEPAVQAHEPDWKAVSTDGLYDLRELRFLGDVSHLLLSVNDCSSAPIPFWMKFNGGGSGRQLAAIKRSSRVLLR